VATRYGNKTLGLRLRLVLKRGAAFGPGKADLLEQIAATGSIAAAGRRLRMSYTRAWGLVEEMNGAFRVPLVESAKGGAVRGGARLTALGEDVLARYRRMERAAARAGAADLASLRKRLA
jgi:molybdate transport system regulatory protein